MPLAADSLLDRIKLKSQLRRWRSLALFMIIALGFLLLNKPTVSIMGLEKGMIARVSIKDVIFEDEDRTEILEGIAKNDSIKAVVVHINSPGGTVVGGEMLYDSLRTIAAKKPVVAVMNSVAASGGYMVALGTDYIFAHRGTITGSIGVVLQTAEFTELADKLGVKFLTFKSGPLKAVPSPFEKLPAEGRDAIQSSVEDTYNLFVDMVVERRKLPRATVLKLADGRVYTGGQALKYQLIDAIGGEKEAVKWLQEKKKIAPSLEVREIKLEKQKGFLENVLSSFSFMGHKFFAPKIASGGLFSLWLPGT